MVGLGAVGVAVAMGTVVGLLAGYSPKLVSYPLLRAVDVVYAFPALMLILGLIAVLGRGLLPLIIAISVINVPVIARLLRAQVLTIKERDYVTAVRALGASAPRVVLLHVLPNSFGPVLVQATVLVGYAILAEASLNYLGLGIPPPDPTWGGEVAAGFRYIRTDPLLSIVPGMAIVLLVLSFNLAGDALRDALDPKLKGR
ncbi:MAG: ABC transporter permease [Dehalococcoidia bacterium]